MIVLLISTISSLRYAPIFLHMRTTSNSGTSPIKLTVPLSECEGPEKKRGWGGGRGSLALGFQYSKIQSLFLFLTPGFHPIYKELVLFFGFQWPISPAESCTL